QTALWTWISGSEVPNQDSVYGAKGVPAPGNTPGARSDAFSWTDAAGDLWLFGGRAPGWFSAGVPGDAMWRFEPDTGMWTWMSGSRTSSPIPVYGTLGQ